MISLLLSALAFADPSETAPPASAEAVTKISDSRYAVDRTLLEPYCVDPASIAAAARFLPHKDATGAIDGYRISGIRAGTLPALLSLQNGDVLVSVGPILLNDPSVPFTLCRAFDKDVTAGSLVTLNLIRKGAPQPLQYEIR